MNHDHYYYIPVSSLNFTNLLSSDSISPSSFYTKRGYGFRRFEKTPSNFLDNVLLAYSKPVTEPEKRTQREDYLINIRIPSHLIEGAKPIKTDDLEVRVVPKTIHFGPFSANLVFRSEEERKRIFAIGMKSLEAKFLQFYHNGSLLLSDLESEPILWDDSMIKEISDVKFNYAEIEKDQRFNKIKGVIFGFSSGLLSSGSPETTAAKNFIKEFNNEYSSILNQLSTIGSGSKKGSVTAEALKPSIRRLETITEKITTLTRVMEENNELEIMARVTQAPVGEIEKWKNYRLSKAISVYDIVLEYLEDDFLDQLPLQKILHYLIERVNHVARYKSPKDYNKLQEVYSGVRHDMISKVELFSLNETATNTLDEIPLEISSDFTLKSAKLGGISPLELESFVLAINEIISSPEISSSDEIGQMRKEFVSRLGQKLKATNEEKYGENGDLDFLRGLFKSIQTVGTGFRIEEGKNITLKVLASFVNKYVEFEKYLDFLAKNQLTKKDIAFALWGGAYGYSNLSKLAVEPLERDEFSSRELYGFIEGIGKHKKNSNVNQDIGDNQSVQEPEPRSVEWIIKEGDQGKNDSANNGDNELNEIMIRFETAFKEDKNLVKNEDWLAYSLKKLSAILHAGRIEDNDENRLSDFKRELDKKERPKGFGPKKIDEVVALLKNCMNG